MTARSVPITLDRLRHLRDRFNDFADLQATDPIIFREGIESMKLPNIRLFLWVGLRHEDPDLQHYPSGVMKAGDLIEAYLENGGKILELARKIGEAVDVSTFVETQNKTPDKGPEPVKNPSGSG